MSSNQPKPKECKKANCSFTGAHSHAVPKNYYPEATEVGAKPKKTKCCKYHNDFLQFQMDNDIEFGTDLNDCGMAGMGAALLCCENCPLNSFYNPNSKEPAWHSSNRPVEYLKDLKKEDYGKRNIIYE